MTLLVELEERAAKYGKERRAQGLVVLREELHKQIAGDAVRVSPLRPGDNEKAPSPRQLQLAASQARISTLAPCRPGSQA